MGFYSERGKEIMFKYFYMLSRKNALANKIMQFVYKCMIPRTTQIGKNVIFNHNGLGVVIHPNSKIEDNVYIEHHVCLGQKTGDDTSAPVIRKNTVIGAYSVILGGG